MVTPVSDALSSDGKSALATRRFEVPEKQITLIKAKPESTQRIKISLHKL